MGHRESCAFAFDAILVSFMVRHFFWLFFSNRYSTENRQKDVAFFCRFFGESRQKSKNG